jgi:quercetin dioxygenase-like cupin family protein
MYFEPHAHLDEHSAPHPILFLAMEGSGTVRLGGPQGEARLVTAGDAVLWPADIDHTVWTEDQELSAIVINLFPGAA